MARASLHLFPYIYSPDGIDIRDGSMTSRTEKKAVFTDSTSGDRLIIEGKSLAYDKGELADGIVTRFSIVDDSGKKYVTFDNVDLDADRFSGDFASNLEDLLADIYQNDMRVVLTNKNDTLAGWDGDDLILGRDGDDYISGEKGRDVLVGGEGIDKFEFRDGFGKDTIKDFDADASDGTQDRLLADYAEIEAITRSGKDTVIDFGDGDTLTLLNVKPGDIDATDFIL